jgi:hypothetical protein
MKQFIIIIATESGKKFIYFKKHYREPSLKQLDRWMKEENNEEDIKEGWWYDSLEDIEKIKGFKILPNEIETVHLHHNKK